jgi:prevent-host-death family protein
MKQVKIAELKDQLSRHLRDVEHGEEIVVTDRSRPIARILPIEQIRPPIALRPPKQPFSTIRDKVYPPANWAISSTELLLEERGER